MQITKRRLAPSSKYETPYYIIRGSANGRTVVVTAGVHGNEMASIAAAKKLLRLIQQHDVYIHSGKLILVPIVNQIAYKRHIRGKPDLNRTFPRHSRESARHPLSASLFRLAKRNRPDWYIDLHEANGFSKRNPRVLGQTLIANPRSKAVPAMKRVTAKLNGRITNRSRHFTIKLRSLPGSGRNAAYGILKSRAITVETSWEMPRSTRVGYQVDIVRRLLREAKLTSD